MTENQFDDVKACQKISTLLNTFASKAKDIAFEFNNLSILLRNDDFEKAKQKFIDIDHHLNIAFYYFHLFTIFYDRLGVDIAPKEKNIVKEVNDAE